MPPAPSSRRPPVAARYPRAAGCLLALVGTAGAAWLVRDALRNGVAYIFAFLFATSFAAAGAWSALTGRVWITPGNPRWWRAGFVASLALGALAGLIVVFGLLLR